MIISNSYCRAALLYGCLGTFWAVDCARAAVDERQFTHAASHFRTACSPDLSEKTFRSSLEGVGGKEGSTSGMPFSIAFGLPGFLGATYYRQPTKCCISIRDAPFDMAIDRMSRLLGLRDPKPIASGERKGVVFRPEHSNRIVSMDFSKSASTTMFMTNICHSAIPNAGALYRSLGR